MLTKMLLTADVALLLGLLELGGRRRPRDPGGLGVFQGRSPFGVFTSGMRWQPRELEAPGRASAGAQGLR
jgi:hypothetical protein